MRYFFRGDGPPVSRILLVESGSRHLLEGLIPQIRADYGEDACVDLVTCFSGLPSGFPPDSTTVHRVGEYRGPEGRARLFRELAAREYTILGMICAAEPIMTKWKWALALRLPAKVFVVNENGDWFWLDRTNWRTIRHFVLFRAGLTGADAPRTLARVALFPFTLLYLLLYATAVHTRRLLRRGSL